MNKKITEFRRLGKKIAVRELSVSTLEAREYRGVSYWCADDGLCELHMDAGIACGSEDLLRDMIDVDMEGFQ
ncbi:MAG: hypothetical protein ACYCT2_03190 [Thermoplasmataceae archaeon]